MEADDLAAAGDLERDRQALEPPSQPVVLGMADALQIVLDLAKQGVIDDPEMLGEMRRQLVAIAMVEGLAVSEYGGD